MVRRPPLGGGVPYGEAKYATLPGQGDGLSAERAVEDDRPDLRLVLPALAAWMVAKRRRRRPDGATRRWSAPVAQAATKTGWSSAVTRVSKLAARCASAVSRPTTCIAISPTFTTRSTMACGYTNIARGTCRRWQ